MYAVDLTQTECFNFFPYLCCKKPTRSIWKGTPNFEHNWPSLLLASYSWSPQFTVAVQLSQCFKLNSFQRRVEHCLLSALFLVHPLMGKCKNTSDKATPRATLRLISVAWALVLVFLWTNQPPAAVANHLSPQLKGTWPSDEILRQIGKLSCGHWQCRSVRICRWMDGWIDRWHRRTTHYLPRESRLRAHQQWHARWATDSRRGHLSFTTILYSSTTNTHKHTQDKLPCITFYSVPFLLLVLRLHKSFAFSILISKPCILIGHIIPSSLHPVSLVTEHSFASVRTEPVKAQSRW